MDNDFETFAKKLCEYCMAKYVLPYLRERGVLMSYRAQVISIDSNAKTMVVQRPYDKQITVPYSNTAASLQVGDFCEVFVLGDGSNSKVVSDALLNIINRDGSAIVIPTKTSELTNDSGFITASQAPKEIWYGTSSTGATTAAKVVTTTTGNFNLTTGAMVRVKFSSANSYNGTATLNVDGKGAKDIARVGTTKTTRYWWNAGEVIDFVYDGTNFMMVQMGAATTTFYGMTKLVDSVTSTSTALAATGNSVKQAYDRAARVPDPPTAAGTYTLQCTVDSGGAATWSWV